MSLRIEAHFVKDGQKWYNEVTAFNIVSLVMLFIVQLMLGVVILMTSIKDRKEQIMNKRTIQIDVIGKVEGTQFMKCKLYTNENIVIIMMNEFDYERLKKEGIFIRDGKSRDSAGVLNTTNTFIEEN